jgi:acyl-CoA thioester hydrolase
MAKTEIRVIYGDTDQMGVVYYGNYLRFFEGARSDFLREKGTRWRDVESAHGVYLPVIEAKVNYKRPAFYDDLLVVETTLAELGRASLRFEYKVLRRDDLLATGHTVHACVNKQGEIREFPAAFSDRLRP